MAQQYAFHTGSFATTANATKSIWLANPATDAFLLQEFGVSFDGSAAAAAIGIELYRTTTLGSPAGTTATQVKLNPVGDAATPTTTALTALSAEPTAVEIGRSWFVSPFSGLLVIQFPLGQEMAAAAAGARIGLRYTTPTGVSPNCRSYAVYTE